MYSNGAVGVSSARDGCMDVMMERSSSQDDEKGLREGVFESKADNMGGAGFRFGVDGGGDGKEWQPYNVGLELRHHLQVFVEETANPGRDFLSLREKKGTKDAENVNGARKGDILGRKDAVAKGGNCEYSALVDRLDSHVHVMNIEAQENEACAGLKMWLQNLHVPNQDSHSENVKASVPLDSVAAGFGGKIAHSCLRGLDAASETDTERSSIIEQLTTRLTNTALSNAHIEKSSGATPVSLVGHSKQATSTLGIWLLPAEMQMIIVTSDQGQDKNSN